MAFHKHAAVLALLTLPVFAYGAASYIPLEPLPLAAPSSGTDLATYLPGMFRLIIAVTAVLAVLMLVIGGFQYVTSDAIYGKSEGKQRIRNAITGLVLAIVSWLILYSINPRLVEFSLSLKFDGKPPASVSPGDGREGGSSIGGVEAGELDTGPAFTAMSAQGFNVCATNGGCTNPCTVRTNTSCTSLEGIKQTTVDGMIALKAACGVQCTNLTISGGTEVGHESGQYSHYDGYKVDISLAKGDGAAFSKYIVGQIGTNPKADTNYSFSQGGYNYIARYEPARSHWDITVLPPQTQQIGQ